MQWRESESGDFWHAGSGSGSGSYPVTTDRYILYISLPLYIHIYFFYFYAYLIYEYFLFYFELKSFFSAERDPGEKCPDPDHCFYNTLYRFSCLVDVELQLVIYIYIYIYAIRNLSLFIIPILVFIECCFIYLCKS